MPSGIMLVFKINELEPVWRCECVRVRERARCVRVPLSCIGAGTALCMERGWRTRSQRGATATATAL